MEETIIAMVPKVFTNIEVQTTVFHKEGKTYVNSVNIIYDGRIIEKIKFDCHQELQHIQPERIASDYILGKLTLINKKSKSRSTSNTKNAANTIMREFNL